MAGGGRSTGELLILMIAVTVCLLVVVSAVGIFVVELVNPNTDTHAAAQVISGVLNTLIGLVAGFLAGHTDRKARSRNDE